MRFQTRFWVAVQESFSFQDFDRPTGVVNFFSFFVFQFFLFPFFVFATSVFLFSQLPFFASQSFFCFQFFRSTFSLPFFFSSLFSFLLLLFSFSVFSFPFSVQLFTFSVFAFAKNFFVFHFFFHFFSKKTFCNFKNFNHEKRPLKVSFQKNFFTFFFAFYFTVVTACQASFTFSFSNSALFSFTNFLNFGRSFSKI